MILAPGALRWRVTSAVALTVAVLAGTAGGGAAVAAPSPGPVEQVALCVADQVDLPATTSPIGAPQRMLGWTRVWSLSRGAGVTVAILSTGVNEQPAFRGRLAGGGDLVDPAKGRGGLVDCDGTGTALAGVIGAAPDTQTGFAGVAPEARLLSIRQDSLRYARAADRGKAGVGTLVTLASALTAAVGAGADVVLIPTSVCTAGSANDQRALADAIDRAVSADTLVVTAAGDLSVGGCEQQNPAHGDETSVAWPASVPQAVTVGALTAAGGASEFSLRGSWVDLAAPGEGIVTVDPFPGSSRVVDALVTPDGQVAIQGTGYAAAYVAGVAALVRARFPGLTAEQVSNRLRVTADHPAGPRERTAALGAGVINPRRALTQVLPEEASAGLPAPASAPATPAAAPTPGRTAAAPTALPAPAPAPDDGPGALVALAGSGLLLLLLASVVAVRLARGRVA